MSTTTLNGQAVQLTPAHRPEFITTPVAATIGVSIELDRADLVAALSVWDGMEFADLDNDDFARSMIVEATVNYGLCQLESVRIDIEDMAADSDRQEWVAYCRRRVAQLFPEVPATRRRVTRRTAATARELVTA